MPYLIETYDAPERAHLRQERYDAHLAFLADNAHLLLACGAKLDDAGEKASGGIYLIDADDRTAANAFIEVDPFHQAGLFARVEVTRWRKAYVNFECFLGRAAPMNYFRTSAGHKVAYQVDGDHSAPPVVLIGSIGSTRHIWRKVIPLLSQKLRVISFDARGHGESGAPAGPYSAADLADDVVALLDHLGIEMAHVVGLSIGGQTALQLALAHPERVRRIVVSNTGAKIGTAQAWIDRAATVEADGLDGIADAIVETWLTPSYAAEHPEEVEELTSMLVGNDPIGYAACCHALSDFDTSEHLIEISAPLLAIGAEDDGPTPPDVTHRLSDGVVDGRFVSIAGAHIPAFESPELYARSVLDHLTANPTENGK